MRWYGQSGFRVQSFLWARVGKPSVSQQIFSSLWDVSNIDVKKELSEFQNISAFSWSLQTKSVNKNLVSFVSCMKAALVASQSPFCVHVNRSVPLIETNTNCQTCCFGWRNGWGGRWSGDLGGGSGGEMEEWWMPLKSRFWKVMYLILKEITHTFRNLDYGHHN